MSNSKPNTVAIPFGPTFQTMAAVAHAVAATRLTYRDALGRAYPPETDAQHLDYASYLLGACSEEVQTSSVNQLRGSLMKRIAAMVATLEELDTVAERGAGKPEATEDVEHGRASAEGGVPAAGHVAVYQGAEAVGRTKGAPSEDAEGSPLLTVEEGKGLMASIPVELVDDAIRAAGHSGSGYCTTCKRRCIFAA